METSFGELRCKDVINVTDGKNLGRTCDIVFCYPGARVLGIVVPGKRGLHLFKKNDLFIPLKEVVNIGVDTVLVDLKMRRPPAAENGARRDYSEYE